MIRLPPISTRTDTLFPYTTLFRSRRGAAERTEIADVAVLDQEVLKALQIVQRVPVAADRPLHPGRTAVQDDLLTYVERLRALAGPLVADRKRRVAIGIGAGDHVFDALGCTGDFVRKPVTVSRFSQGQIDRVSCREKGV